jgi:hypothetical protein
VFTIRDIGTGQIFLTNSIGAEIWALCDGSRTVDAVKEHLVNKYPAIPQETIERDMVEFLMRCREKRVLYFSDGEKHEKNR